MLRTRITQRLDEIMNLVSLSPIRSLHSSLERKSAHRFVARRIGRCQCASPRNSQIRNAFLASLFWFGITAASVCGESIDERLPTLNAPTKSNQAMPRYPTRPLSDGEEGWVQLHAMISPEGKAYDIVVEDAAGHHSFVNAAIRALKRSEFNPGTIDGEPVDSAYSQKITFSIESGNRNRYFPSFRGVFRDVITSVQNKNMESATKQLHRLAEARKTLFEDALYWTAKFYFEREWGTPSAQLEALSKAIAYESSSSYLEPSLFQQLLWSRLKLQLELSHYMLALRTINLIEALDQTSDHELTELASKRDAIEALRDSEQAFLVTGRLDSNGEWSHTMLRNKFAVVDVDGVLNEYSLYCQKDVVRFPHRVDYEYSIDGVHGECWLHAIGKPGTTFTYVQL